MNFLEERITRDGIVKEGNVLKVDSFLNHQMDIELFDQMGEEWARRFKDKKINKILTIEASGIGIACIVAKHFHVPDCFAKKSKSINLEGEMYIAEVESFTHKCKNQVIVSKKFLSPEDHVLIIDDFLANGARSSGTYFYYCPGRSFSRRNWYCGRKRISGRRKSHKKSRLFTGVSGYCRFHECRNRRNCISTRVEYGK